MGAMKTRKKARKKPAKPALLEPVNLPARRAGARPREPVASGNTSPTRRPVPGVIRWPATTHQAGRYCCFYVTVTK